jgi:hypothetical protein
MLTRICRGVATAAALLLVAVGAVVLAAAAPAVLVGVLTMGAIFGLIVATQLPRTGPPALSRTRRGAAGVGAAVIAVSALLATAGSAALLGAAAAPVLLLLLLGAGAGLWRHRTAWRAYATALSRGTIPPADTAAASWTGAAAAPPTLGANPTVRALCLAWQRTDRSLHGMPAGPARAELISTRERLLDELEHLDPVGFRSWMYRGAHATSDPSHYLTENRTSTARIPRGNDSSAS